MNINNKLPTTLFRSKIVIRLWAIMMIIVLLMIAFMWVIQIFIFERNYVNATISEVQEQLNPIMEDLKTEDLAYNEKLIPYLSKSINGKMLLVDGEGELIALYSYGHPIDLEGDRTEVLVWSRIKTDEVYSSILAREPYNRNVVVDNRLNAYEIGIPVVYNGEASYVILHRSFAELFNVLDMNRTQLIALSIILTVVTALIAWVLARQFVKPIHTIKNTVNRLAEGDLTATPEVKQKDELGQLSDSVVELGQSLQRVDVLRKEVIANVSHELRSPLALIGGYAEMVRDITWNDEVKRTDDLNLIISESGRMSEMINDIMDYSQLQSGYMQLSKDFYNLYDIVESEIHHCKKMAEEYGITLDIESPEELSVSVDALKIAQVMRNLLYNAINHAKDNGAVQVVVQEEKERYKILVINDGEPIPMEDRSVIWERYQRSQHQGGRRQGTGIGLSIVSTILKAHNMPYGVDCVDGKIIFWFCCKKQ